FDAWAAGVWARFDVPASMFVETPHGFSMAEVCIGLSVERRLLRRPLEVRAELVPSVAVISMVGDAGEQHADGGKVDARFGLGLRAAYPLTSALQIVAGIDGELAPAGLAGGASRRIDPILPPVPTFTVGTTLGVSLGVL